MIISFNDLTKRSTPQDFENLIAVGNVIMDDHIIGAVSIIVAIVTLLGKFSGDLVIKHQRSNEIDLAVVDHFVSFKRTQ